MVPSQAHLSAPSMQQPGRGSYYNNYNYQVPLPYSNNMFNPSVFNNPGQQFSPLDQQADNYQFKVPGDHSSQQIPGKSKERKLNHTSGESLTDEDEVGEEGGAVTRKINMVSHDLKTLRKK